MDRKEFIKHCGYACTGGLALAALLQSCGTTRQLNGEIEGDDMIVSVKDFEVKKRDGAVHFKKYLVVQHELLQYPICIYRLGENEYKALWMRCTHQGTELQVFGEKLQCPAHGSEFDNRGQVKSGPADTQLRTFPATLEGNRIKISLKAL